MARYSMVIDLERCTGCRACMQACKVENNTPTASLWMYVFRFEEGTYPNTHVWLMPRPCMHCNNAPCVKVCPVGARYKREGGLTATDWERCIGCRYCMQACPYGVRYFNEMDPKRNYYLDWEGSSLQGSNPGTGGVIPPYKNPDLDQRYPVGLSQFRGETALLAGGGRLKGVVKKCTFCAQRVEKGLVPACVANCPLFALHFSDLEDPHSRVSGLLQKHPHFRLLDEFGTKPKVYYLRGQPLDMEAREIEVPGVST